MFGAQSDPLYGISKKDFDDARPKRIGIIGHVNHGKPITCAIVGVGSQRIIPEPIVPIADVIPEPILDKQDFIKMHDKAVECSITDEAYKESRAWDIKKQKKTSHKRTNKRKR